MGTEDSKGLRPRLGDPPSTRRDKDEMDSNESGGRTGSEGQKRRDSKQKYGKVSEITGKLTVHFLVSTLQRQRGRNRDETKSRFYNNQFFFFSGIGTHYWGVTNPRLHLSSRRTQTRWVPHLFT